MREYLIFTLYGPMVSFGDIAVGEYRPTSAHPSKSMIMGLVAGAMGIERHDENRLHELNKDIGFGVLVLTTGTLLRDYHTAQVPSASSSKKSPIHTRKDELSIDNLNTILSTRDYRMDAVYLIAIWSNTDENRLKKIQQSLEKPVFTPYIGRKSCPPAIPFNPKIVKANSAAEALTGSGYSVDDLLFEIIKESSYESVDEKKQYLLYQDAESESTDNVIKKSWRKDRLINRHNWQFGDREEILITVGGGDVFQ